MKVSFIIPVYNCEKYIDKCLSSIDTDIDHEIIVVNDGSTDNSLKLLRSFEKKLDNFIVIDQDNQKQGAARNNGLKVAKGEFIWFVDADDWVDTSSLTYFLDLMNQRNLDLLRFDAQDYLINKDEYRKRKCKHIPLRLYNDNEAFFENIYSVCVPFYIFRKQFLLKNQLLFLEKTFYEDSLFILEVFERNPKFCYVPRLAYNVSITEVSTTRNNLNSRLDMFNIVFKLLDIYNNVSESKKKVVALQIVVMINTFFYGARKDDKIFKLGLNRINEIKSLDIVYKENTSMIHKVQGKLLRYPKLLKILLNLYYR